MKLTAIAIATAMAAAAAGTARCHAAIVAADNASNYASGTTWPGTSGTTNGGTGFSPWVYNNLEAAGPPYVGQFFDTSSKNIGTGGDAFGQYANSATTTDATPSANSLRDFISSSGSGLGTLRAGQTFSIALQSGGVDNGTGAEDGFSLQNGTGAGATNVFSLAYIGGASAKDDLSVTDANGTQYLGSITGGGGALGFANGIGAGIDVSFTPGVSTGVGTPYTLAISPAAGNTGFTGPLVYTGTINNSALNQVDAFTTNTSNDGYFNSLAVTGVPTAVPAPAALSIATGGLLALAAAGWRRKWMRA